MEGSSATTPAVVNFDVQCTRCGASLSGAAFAGSCAGCGLAVANTIAVEAIDRETLQVSSDLECVGCGYNLRMQPTGGVCPECAAPVGTSLRRRELAFARPQWLRRVRLGVLLLTAWFAWGTVESLLLGLVIQIGGMGMVYARIVLDSTLLMAVWCAGIVLACSAERENAPPPRLQRIARVLALLAAGWSCACMLYAAAATAGEGGWAALSFQAIVERRWGHSGAGRVLDYLLLWSSSTGAAVLLLAVLATIARRAGRRGLRAYLHVLIGITLLFAVLSALVPYVGWIGGPGVFGCATPVRSLLMFIGMVLVYRVLGSALRAPKPRFAAGA